jgi:hypothetical protein
MRVYLQAFDLLWSSRKGNSICQFQRRFGGRLEEGMVPWPSHPCAHEGDAGQPMGADAIAPALSCRLRRLSWLRRSVADIATTSRRRGRKVTGRRPASGSSYSRRPPVISKASGGSGRGSALLATLPPRRADRTRSQKLRLTILVYHRVPQIHLRDSPDQIRATTNPHQQGGLALHDSFCWSITFTAIRDHKSRRITSSRLSNQPASIIATSQHKVRLPCGQSMILP